LCIVIVGNAGLCNFPILSVAKERPTITTINDIKLEANLMAYIFSFYLTSGQLSTHYEYVRLENVEQLAC